VRHHRQLHKGENRGGGGGGLPTAELGTVRRKQTKGRGLKYGGAIQTDGLVGSTLAHGREWLDTEMAASGCASAQIAGAAIGELCQAASGLSCLVDVLFESGLSKRRG
jgi:hypothetical protein